MDCEGESYYEETIHLQHQRNTHHHLHGNNDNNNEIVQLPDDRNDEFDDVEPPTGSICFDDDSDEEDDYNDIQVQERQLKFHSKGTCTPKYHHDNRKSYHDSQNRRTSSIFPSKNMYESPNEKEIRNDVNDSFPMNQETPVITFDKKNKNNTSKRSRKSVLLPGEDDHDSDTDTEDNDTDRFDCNDNHTRTSKKKRARQSMELPNNINELLLSPSSEEERNDKDHKNDPRKKKNRNMDISSSSSCDNKRSQVRKSLLLPSDDDGAATTDVAITTKSNGMSNIHIDEYIKPQSNMDDNKQQQMPHHHHHHRVNTIPTTIPTTTTTTNHHHHHHQIKEKEKICSEKLQKVNEAIRRFCSTPLEERYKSDEAIIVEELTGYPLITAMDKLHRNREKKEAAERLLLCTSKKLNSVSSSCSKIEESKDSLTKENEQRRLVHDVRRGIVTQMGSLIPIMEARKKQDTESMETDTGCRVERKKGRFKYIELISGVKVSSSEYEKRYLSALQQIRILRQEVEKQIVSDASSEEECASKNDQVHSEHHRNHNESSSINDDKIPTILRNNDGAMSCDIEFPSRDDLSSDPEEAAAQIKLFAAFDHALREYSDVVLRIKMKKEKREQAAK